MIFMENYLCNFEQGLAEILSPPLGACGLCRPLQALITPTPSGTLCEVAGVMPRHAGSGPAKSWGTEPRKLSVFKQFDSC